MHRQAQKDEFKMRNSAKSVRGGCLLCSWLVVLCITESKTKYLMTADIETADLFKKKKKTGSRRMSKVNINMYMEEAGIKPLMFKPLMFQLVVSRSNL